MSHRLVLTVPNDHFDWLEIVRKKKGLESIQEAIRSVLEDSYSSYTESNAMQPLDINRAAKPMIRVPVSSATPHGGIQ